MEAFKQFLGFSHTDEKSLLAGSINDNKSSLNTEEAPPTPSRLGKFLDFTMTVLGHPLTKVVAITTTCIGVGLLASGVTVPVGATLIAVGLLLLLVSNMISISTAMKEYQSFLTAMKEYQSFLTAMEYQ